LPLACRQGEQDQRKKGEQSWGLHTAPL
jgi:hypothetical protein